MKVSVCWGKNSQRRICPVKWEQAHLRRRRHRQLVGWRGNTILNEDGTVMINFRSPEI